MRSNAHSVELNFPLQNVADHYIYADVEFFIYVECIGLPQSQRKMELIAASLNQP